MTTLLDEGAFEVLCLKCMRLVIQSIILVD